MEIKGKRTVIASDEAVIQCTCGYEFYVCIGDDKCSDCKDLKSFTCLDCGNKVLID